MGGNRKLMTALAAIALCALFASPRSEARVSWSWGAGSQSGKALAASGGKSVYEADISLNGADADLSVFSFNEAAPRLAAKLNRLFKDAGFKFRGGTMAFALVEEEKLVIRMIILQVADSSKTLVIKIEQSARDYEASKDPPSKHMMREVPEFPGSRPSFFAHNKDTDFQIASSTVNAAPSDIRAFYSEMLPARGWKHPLEDSSSLQVFTKGNAVCMVLASKKSAGRSSITVLHKTHGVK